MGSLLDTVHRPQPTTISQHVFDLIDKLGGKALLLPIPRGMKSPIFLGWQLLRFDETENPSFKVALPPKRGQTQRRELHYWRALSTGNIGILQGQPSEGLVSVDIDDDADIAQFLNLNPGLEHTLQTRGSRGRNFWLQIVRADGQRETGPIQSFDITDSSGKKRIEFRADGRQTVIYGQHPSGKNYEFLNDCPILEIPFSEIVFPQCEAGDEEGKQAWSRSTVSAATERNRYSEIPDSPRLQKRRKILESVFGEITWDSHTFGVVHTCPGEHLHSNDTQLGHTYVYADKMPLCHCYHKSCAENVKECNKKVRDELFRIESIHLPTASVTREDCATELFSRIAEERGLFIRGGVVVELTKDEDGTPIFKPLEKASAVSRVETYASFHKLERKKQDDGSVQTVQVPTQINQATVEELMKTHAAMLHLPHVHEVINVPLLYSRDHETVEELKPGYNAGAQIYVSSHMSAMPVELDEAVASLKDLLSEYEFDEGANFSRALADLITPLLVWGSFLNDPQHPIMVGEADAIGAGKSMRMMAIAELYGETAAMVREKTAYSRGVGSTEEDFYAYMIKGRNFILFDNLSRTTDMRWLEALVTGPSSTSVRIAFQGHQTVNLRRTIYMMTSNGFKCTPDLSDRSSFVRVKKRHDVEFKHNLVARVRENQTYYLGCIYAVVRAWNTAGRPKTGTTAHRFREWAGVCDWIVQNIFHEAPLMQGHREVQHRVSSPYLSFFYEIADHVKHQDLLNSVQKPLGLGQLAISMGIEVPTLPDHAQDRMEEVARATGRTIRFAFQAVKEETLSLGNIEAHRIERYSSTKGRNEFYLVFTERSKTSKKLAKMLVDEHLENEKSRESEALSGGVNL